jgi:outer membrane protein TolC
MKVTTRRRTCVVPGLLAVLVGVPGWTAAAGQQGAVPDTLRLTIDAAVQRALERSEEIQSARAQLDQAEARVTQARATGLPQVGTALNYSRAIRTVFDAEAPPPADTTRIPDAFDPARSPYDRYDILSDLMTQDFVSGLFSGLPFGRRNTYVATLQLSQTLFTGGRISGTRDGARHFEAAANHRLAEAEADIVLQVRVAYLNAVLARRLLGVAEESRRIAEEHLRQTESFRAAGTVSEFDLLRARVDFQNRDPAVVQAANLTHLALLELKRLVNLPLDEPVDLVSVFDPAVVTVDEAVLRRQVADRPLLLAAREAVAMRQAGVRVARSEWFPAVRLIGNFGFQAYPDHVTPPLSNWRGDWNVQLAVTWMPFDGFGRRGRIREAQAQLQDAVVQRAQVQEGLEVELTGALGDYRTAQAETAARRETVDLARQTLDLAELRYRNGLATQLEVSDAALLLDQAHVNEIQALHDVVKALAQLERLSGGRLQLLSGREP